MKKRKIIALLSGIMAMLILFGCTGKKYKLVFDGYGFKSKKTSYAAGELVTVYYDLIGTDTDYYFNTDSDDVELERDYNEKDGYIFKFRMPAHDVVLSVDSRNSMEYIPDEDNE